MKNNLTKQTLQSEKSVNCYKEWNMSGFLNDDSDNEWNNNIKISINPFQCAHIAYGTLCRNIYDSLLLWIFNSTYGDDYDYDDALII